MTPIMTHPPFSFVVCWSHSWRTWTLRSYRCAWVPWTPWWSGRSRSSGSATRPKGSPSWMPWMRKRDDNKTSERLSPSCLGFPKPTSPPNSCPFDSEELKWPYCLCWKPTAVLTDCLLSQATSILAPGIYTRLPCFYTMSGCRSAILDLIFVPVVPV